MMVLRGTAAHAGVLQPGEWRDAGRRRDELPALQALRQFQGRRRARHGRLELARLESLGAMPGNRSVIVTGVGGLEAIERHRVAGGLVGVLLVAPDWCARGRKGNRRGERRLRGARGNRWRDGGNPERDRVHGGQLVRRRRALGHRGNHGVRSLAAASRHLRERARARPRLVVLVRALLRRLCRRRRCRGRVERCDQALDLLVARIGLEHPVVPGARRAGVALHAGDVAEVPERDEVFRVERECGFEHASRIVEPTAFVQRLPVDDVPAHVAGLLREELLADHDRLLEVAHLPELVGERGEIPPRILVELLLELVDAGGAGHQHLGSGAQAAVEGSGIMYRTRGTSQSEVPSSLDFSPRRRVAFSASLPSVFPAALKESCPCSKPCGAPPSS